ncbi:hypothetical protein, partial [Bartonella sp. CL42QHWL]|uniref:hypothetical protein n=1 Tax=Bartonella sp. CL42QHWL TaxID=3243528 RepID=UPI0035D0A734
KTTPINNPTAPPPFLKKVPPRLKAIHQPPSSSPLHLPPHKYSPITKASPHTDIQRLQQRP